MLINTVILFLRDALPVFVVMIILLSLLQQRGIRHHWCYIALVVGIICSAVLLTLIDTITHALDDTGREWFYVCLYFICYGITLLLLNQTPSNSKTTLMDDSRAITRYGAVMFVAIIMMLNSANFLIYITGFWHQNNAANVLTTGLILGMGICASIAVLLYFMMDAVQHYYHLIRETLLVFFSAGLLMQTSNLLLQIDVLPMSKTLWDSNHFILESSEIGYLLTVFFGYDATPNSIQLLLYVTAIVIASILVFIRSSHQPRNGSKKFKEAMS
jgi:high-affinity iron transporter